MNWVTTVFNFNTYSLPLSQYARDARDHHFAPPVPASQLARHIIWFSVVYCRMKLATKKASMRRSKLALKGEWTFRCVPFHCNVMAAHSAIQGRRFALHLRLLVSLVAFPRIMRNAGTGEVDGTQKWVQAQWKCVIILSVISFDNVDVKIQFLGDGYTGKTNIITRYAKDSFTATKKPTIATEIYYADVSRDASSLHLQLWVCCSTKS